MSRAVMQQALDAIRFTIPHCEYTAKAQRAAIEALKAELAKPEGIVRITWDDKDIRTVNGVPDNE